MYSIPHYVIKFVSELRQAGGFLRTLRFHPTNKTDRHDIAELLLKVALNTITPNHLYDLNMYAEYAFINTTVNQ